MTEKTRRALQQEPATEGSGLENHDEDGHLQRRPEEPGLEMTGEQKPTSVREWHAREDFLDPVQLLRSIQRAEGSSDCFRSKDKCEEMECAWRPYCISDPFKPA